MADDAEVSGALKSGGVVLACVVVAGGVDVAASHGVVVATAESSGVEVAGGVTLVSAPDGSGDGTGLDCGVELANRRSAWSCASSTQVLPRQSVCPWIVSAVMV